jgi:hypothetical protein
LKRIQQGGEANPTSKKFLEVAKSAAVQWLRLDCTVAPDYFLFESS